MLVSDVIDRVRQSLNDTDPANYRWTLTELLRYLNDGVTESVALRPDLNLNDAGAVKTFTTLTALGNTVDVDATLLMPLVDYVCAKALMEDNPDKSNAALAALRYQTFTRTLTGA